MSSWTHLIRFIAVEDNKTHLGQLVDVSCDAGLNTLNGIITKAYMIDGDTYSGEVTDVIRTVKRTLKLLSPISREHCNYIRCIGLNYTDHVKEANFAFPRNIEMFTKPRMALTDPFPATTSISKCAQDGTSDYEGELCVVIGKSGRDIPEDEALGYVLGYTAANDISARALQLQTSQACFSKGLDYSCPVGPVLVSPSVIIDPQNVAIKTTYNGQTVQSGHTRNMIFSVKRIIADLSRHDS